MADAGGRIRVTDVSPRPRTGSGSQHDNPVGNAAESAVRATVVVCAFTERRWSQLQRAVESVHSQTRPVSELIVVIDHNEDLFQRARAALSARVVSNEDVQGLSGARNTGLALAAGDVVVFLDDDAHAEPDWLEHLLQPYVDQDVVAVGGHVEASFDGRRPDFLPPEFDWVIGCSYRGLPEAPAEVRNVIGANMSFRREVFDRAGGFEVSLGRIGDRPLGCEETELCIRATAAVPGGRVVLQPSARVHHSVPTTRTTWAYFRSRCYAEGLSKAAVARLAGTNRGLASERAYVTRTLPVGVVDALSDAVLFRRRGGLARATAIVTGLVLTTIGYAVGTVKLRSARTACHEPVSTTSLDATPASGARSAAA